MFVLAVLVSARHGSAPSKERERMLATWQQVGEEPEHVLLGELQVQDQRAMGSQHQGRNR